MEILSPAGSLEKLKYALHYGADAVYCAGKNFSLRAKAGNLSLAEIEQARAICTQLGKKLYITLNIFAHNQDLPELTKFLEFLKTVRPDGVIVSDPGVFSLCRRIIPNIALHISTQANVTNYQSAKFWHEQGATRVVLARELNLDEIAKIKQEIPTLELEVFVHGAMCIAYSGRCLLSAFINDRSANQGACTQVCRWGFAISERKHEGQWFELQEDDYGSYILNSKDLCLLDYLSQLEAIGVTSVKIEGRMKSLYYVANTTRIYKQALAGNANLPKLKSELEKTSHRTYSSGFISPATKGEQNQESSAYVRQYQFLGTIVEQTQGLVKIEIKAKFEIGDTIEFVFPAVEQDFCYSVVSIKNERGTPISKTDPNSIITLPLDKQIPPHGIIRKKL